MRRLSVDVQRTGQNAPSVMRGRFCRVFRAASARDQIGAPKKPIIVG
jgi:hypothetical protein